MAPIDDGGLAEVQELPARPDHRWTPGLRVQLWLALSTTRDSQSQKLSIMLTICKLKFTLKCR